MASGIHAATTQSSTGERRTEDLYEQQLQYLMDQTTKPYRSRGTPVILPFGNDSELLVRPTDDPPRESLKAVDPEFRALYEAHGYPPDGWDNGEPKDPPVRP